MKLTGEITAKIIQIQNENSSKSAYFYENRFLLFCFSLYTEIGTVVNMTLEELDFSEEEITEYIKTLKDEKLFDIKDEKTLKKKSKSEKHDFKNEMEEIINHLNSLTGKRIGLNASREKTIKSLLVSGKYSVEDFKAVNTHFFNCWNNNPNMKQYIRPETLYNSKFDTRIEEAKETLLKIERYKDEIYMIYNKFNEEQGINLLTYKDNISSTIKNSITHWLDNGYTIEDLLITIEETINSWKHNDKLKNHISIERILDEKFPEREKIAKKLKNKKGLPNIKESEHSINEWIEKNSK